MPELEAGCCTKANGIPTQDLKEEGRNYGISESAA